MSPTFPELATKEAHVTAIIRSEEESFSRTLDKGLQKFNEMAEKVDPATKIFAGEDAHFLYTTMGFPVDLTELMAEEKGLTVDTDGFKAKMKEEQEISQAAHLAKMSGGGGKDMRFGAEQTAHLTTKLSLKATDDSAKYVWDEKLTGCTAQALFIGRNETED